MDKFAEKENIDTMIARYNEDSITLRELVDYLEKEDHQGIIDEYEDIDIESDEKGI